MKKGITKLSDEGDGGEFHNRAGCNRGVFYVRYQLEEDGDYFGERVQDLNKNAMGQEAKIEYQAQSGVWIAFGNCANRPAEIKRMLDAALNSQSWIRRSRALDSTTGQLIDMALK